MNLLVLHTYGFISHIALTHLKRSGHTIFEITKNNDHKFSDYILRSDVVLYLVENKGEGIEDSIKVRIKYLTIFLDTIKKSHSKIPLFFLSTLSEDNSLYSQGMRQMEDILINHSNTYGNPLYIVQAPEIFGSGVLPNKYSTVSTYAYNVLNDIEVVLPENRIPIKLCHIDDITGMIAKYLKTKFIEGKVEKIPAKPVYSIRPCDLLDELYYFDGCRKMKFIPSIKSEFSRKLYSTYTSFIKEGDYMQILEDSNIPDGQYIEFVKMGYSGNVGIKILSPGKELDAHYHDTRSEKVSVLSGVVLTRLRNVDDQDIYEYVSIGAEIETLDIPNRYIHSFKNIGKTIATILVWYSEDDEERKEYIDMR